MCGVETAAVAACLLALLVAAGAIIVALLIWRAVVALLDRLAQAEQDVMAARARAEAAERLLSEIRLRRSLAVSKGNRTRAELERARVRETTDAVRDAMRRKQQPQGLLV